MDINNNCPKCNVEIVRKLGLPGIVGTCPKCGEEYIKSLGKLILLKEFHKEADAWVS